MNKYAFVSAALGSVLIALISFLTLGTAASAATDVNAQAIIPSYNPHVDAVQAPSGVFGTGTVWHVGPNEPNTSFAAISRQLKDGDVVEIDAGTYGCSEQSIVWTANNITVIGVGGRAIFDATGCGISGDKGIFNPRGTNMIIDNIEFAGAAGPSANDAGIRLDGGGYVYITNSYFHDNQDGILATPDPGLVKVPTNIVIDHSEFSHNGTSGTGQTHNMYINTVASFVLRFSYSHDAIVGHDVKSRAQSNYILYNRIADESVGTASYNIDLPQGGLSYIIGNVIQKNGSAQNSINITFSVESPTAPANPKQEIYIANNTIINQYPAVGSRRVLFVTDNGLTNAKMVNNLIVGVPQSQLLMGTGANKVTMSNNIVTDAPAFYDEPNRIYNLTSSSPAVNAGIDPGSGGSFSLMPVFQFKLPHDAEPRLASGALDVGAYEYTAGQTVTPAPTLTFSAVKNTIEFNTSATITWNATNALSCVASGGWSGTKGTSGSFTTPALKANATYQLSCTGQSGTVTAQPLVISVNDSSQAAALGTYTWRQLPNTKLTGACPDPAKFPGIGGGTSCNPVLTMTTGVYVPDTNMVYYIGGSESYAYFGNEVYAFNLSTMKPVRVTDPTIPSDTLEYKADGTPPYSPPACSRALHTKSGGIAMEANGIGGGAGGAAWDPVIKKIVVGPGGYQRQQGCTIISTYLTDVWTFDPFTKSWAQAMPPDDAFQATAATTWFVDPVSGLAYAGTGGRNNSPIGAYLIDFSTAKPTKALIDNTWPFSTFGGTTAVDTTHHYALQLLPNAAGSPSQVGLYNLNGLSMTKYGTNGSAGTNGLAGGPGPQFDADTSWTVVGDTTLLDYAHASLTYNPKIDMFVAWVGTSKVYFLQLNYSTKTATIISKQIPGGPSATYSYGGMAGYFIYIPSLDEYLVYTGVNTDFWLLVPPTASPSTQPTTTPSISGSVITTGQQVSTTERVRVHSKAVPSAASTLCVQPVGAQGTVQYSPIKAYGYTFVRVKFATGCSGWVVIQYLSKNP